MTKQLNHLSQLLSKSSSILITSHLNPDTDAIGTALAIYNLLSDAGLNVHINLENTLLPQLNLLKGFSQITNMSTKELINKHNIDTLMIFDANHLSRVVSDPDELRDVISAKNINTVCIDHHPIKEPEQFTWEYITPASSAAELAYEVFINKLNYKLTKEVADCFMLGILADTARFLYDIPDHRRLFSVVSDLIEAGSRIEVLSNQIIRYDRDQLPVIAELLNNTVVQNDFSYSFITDEFAQKYAEDTSRDNSAYSKGYHAYLFEYVRKTEDALWGFVATPVLNRHGHYKVSFRSQQSTVNTSLIANALGGGGHANASGADFAADNISDAVKRVLSAAKKAESVSSNK